MRDRDWQPTAGRDWRRPTKRWKYQLSSSWSSVATWSKANGSTDQATVLSQLGMIDRILPCANITEMGRFLRDNVERRKVSGRTAEHLA